MEKWGEDAALYSAHLTKPVPYIPGLKGILRSGSVAGYPAYLRPRFPLLIVGAVSFSLASVGIQLEIH